MKLPLTLIEATPMRVAETLTALAQLVEATKGTPAEQCVAEFVCFMVTGKVDQG